MLLLIIVLVLFLLSDRSLITVLVLAVGLALRLMVGWLDQVGAVDLPWSGADSEGFHSLAVGYSQLDWAAFLAEFNPQRSYVYAWVMGFIMRIFGQEYFYLRVINMVMGGFIAVVIYRALFLGGAGRRAAWLGMCAYLFFPFAIILNSVLLRETVITLCVSLVGLGVLQFYRGRLSGFVFAISAALAAAMFHGAMGLLLMTLLLVAAFRPPQGGGVTQQAFPLIRIEFRLLFGLLALSVLTYVLVFGEFSKIGSATTALDNLNDRLERVSFQGAKGDSGYPVWLTVNVGNPVYWIPRFAYFMAAPFPWDWRSPTDMVSGLVSVIYIILFVWTLRARRLDRGVFVLVALLVVALFVFSIGTDNIGTSIRHRTKFLPLLLIASFVWWNHLKMLKLRK